LVTGLATIVEGISTAPVAFVEYPVILIESPSSVYVKSPKTAARAVAVAAKQNKRVKQARSRHRGERFNVIGS
jgi:hypothetical protein